MQKYNFTAKLFPAFIALLLAVTTFSQSSQFQFLDESLQPGGTYNSSEKANPWIYRASAGWMAKLPDATPLKSISIPGTHDSCSRYGGLAAATQTWTINDQLLAGIRFLDIRTRRTGTSFAIHHGPFFQKLMFGDVMEAISSFLSAYPREVIVMHIRADEHTAEEGSKDFTTIWNNYMTQYSNVIAQNTNSNATLGSLRGKVFVLRSGWDDSTRGIDFWDDNIFATQNYYKVYFLAGDGISGSESANLPGKKKKINEYLDLAATSEKWVLNFLSGSTGMTPPDVASATNYSAYEHIGPNAGKKKLGTVIMDFPGEQLIYRIIKSNFQVPEPTTGIKRSDYFILDGHAGNLSVGIRSTQNYWYATSDGAGQKHSFGGSGQVLSGDVVKLITANPDSAYQNYKNLMAPKSGNTCYYSYDQGDYENWIVWKTNIGMYRGQPIYNGDKIVLENMAYRNQVSRWA